MYKSIKYQDNFYLVEGCTRSGYRVYINNNQNKVYLGRSIAETAYKAVIDVIRNHYSSYF